MSDYHTKEAFEARLAARRADPRVPLPLQAFWHIGCLNHWREVVQEQWGLFQSVGLSPIAGVLGTEKDAAWLRDLGVEVANVNPDFGEWETPTLDLLHQWCLAHPAGSVLYAHSKGVTAPNDPGKAAWRRLMAYYVIFRWRENIEHLAVADIAGVDWLHSPSYPHFSGNFWMARADWIAHLDPARAHLAAGGPSIGGQPWRRMHCEMWLGSKGWHEVCHLCCQNETLVSGTKVFDLVAAARRAEYKRLLDAVETAGSDDIEFFGGRHEGGFHVQQTPQELAEAILFLEGRPYENYLEIGAAAGGSARLLRDVLTIRNVYIIDDNEHPKHTLRPSILPGAIEWIGSSHDPACAEQLARWGRRFDLVLIDGDHSYEGVRQDFALVQPYLASRATILLHDVCSDEGPRRFRAELKAGRPPAFSEIALCGLKHGISIFRKDAL